MGGSHGKGKVGQDGAQSKLQLARSCHKQRNGTLTHGEVGPGAPGEWVLGEIDEGSPGWGGRGCLCGGDHGTESGLSPGQQKPCGWHLSQQRPLQLGPR